jgi:hypothetical protein
VNVPLVTPVTNALLVLLTETEKIVLALMVLMNKSNIKSVTKDVITEVTRNPMDLANHVKMNVPNVIMLLLVLLVKLVHSEKERTVNVKRDTMKSRDNSNVKNVPISVMNVTLKDVLNVMKEEPSNTYVHVEKELSTAMVPVNHVLKTVIPVPEMPKTVLHVPKEEKTTNQNVIAQMELMKRMMFV